MPIGVVFTIRLVQQNNTGLLTGVVFYIELKELKALKAVSSLALLSVLQLQA